MKLALSNMAWDQSEDKEIVNLLHCFTVDTIDIVPGKYFPQPGNATALEIKKVRDWWSDHGVKISGMQSLLFGTVNLNLFGTKMVQNTLLEHMLSICRIGSGLGATRLVFGSPKNRDRTGLTDEQTLIGAVSFFKRLGSIALDYGVTICLEPNPRCYGANFMTTAVETAHMVRNVNHPAIRMQLDTGALTINQESIEIVLADCAELICHVHASEPNLVPLGDLDTDHAALFASMTKYIPDRIVSIEMMATQNEPHLAAIKRALSFATQHYRPIQGVLV